MATDFIERMMEMDFHRSTRTSLQFTATGYVCTLPESCDQNPSLIANVMMHWDRNCPICRCLRRLMFKLMAMSPEAKDLLTTVCIGFPMRYLFDSSGTLRPKAPTTLGHESIVRTKERILLDLSTAWLLPQTVKSSVVQRAHWQIIYFGDESGTAVGGWQCEQ
jgi:hypothetical protein